MYRFKYRVCFRSNDGTLSSGSLARGWASLLWSIGYHSDLRWGREWCRFDLGYQTLQFSQEPVAPICSVSGQQGSVAISTSFWDSFSSTIALSLRQFFFLQLPTSEWYWGGSYHFYPSLSAEHGYSRQHILGISQWTKLTTMSLKN